MATMPAWVSYLQALSTPAIALLAAVIGVMQWRTAHQRAVLDLFERRFETYNLIRSIIAEVLMHGSVPTSTALDFLRAAHKAEFLFGPKVAAYLKSTSDLLVEHGKAEDIMKREDTGYTKGVEMKYAAFTAISRFQQDFPPLVSPYMRMHQKAPPF